MDDKDDGGGGNGDDGCDNDGDGGDGIDNDGDDGDGVMIMMELLVVMRVLTHTEYLLMSGSVPHS